MSVVTDSNPKASLHRPDTATSFPGQGFMFKGRDASPSCAKPFFQGASPRSASPTVSTQSGGSGYNTRSSSPASHPDDFRISSPLPYQPHLSNGMAKPSFHRQSFHRLRAMSDDFGSHANPSALHQSDYSSKQLGPRHRTMSDCLLQKGPPGLQPFPSHRPSFINFERAILPGDVLFLAATGGGLAQVGATGGYMGHVMVALRHPHRIVSGSWEARTLHAVWPAGAREVWKVCTLESTRAEEGLYQTDTLVRIDDETGQLFLIGDLNSRLDGRDLSIMEQEEAIEIWQSPAKLRAELQPDLIKEVVSEMKRCTGSWSLTTAARAYFMEARCDAKEDKEKLMADIAACWNADPICTSVVITFWQRYLCKLALFINASVSAHRPVHPCDLLLQCMPLKADRSLPGDLMIAMKEHGWNNFSRLGDEIMPGAGPSMHKRRLPQHPASQHVDNAVSEGSALRPSSSALCFRKAPRPKEPSSPRSLFAAPGMIPSMPMSSSPRCMTARPSQPCEQTSGQQADIDALGDTEVDLDFKCEDGSDSHQVPPMTVGVQGSQPQGSSSLGLSSQRSASQCSASQCLASQCSGSQGLATQGLASNCARAERRQINL